MSKISNFTEGVFKPYSLVIENSEEHSCLKTIFESKVALNNLNVAKDSPCAEAFNRLQDAINNFNPHK